MNKITAVEEDKYTKEHFGELVDDSDMPKGVGERKYLVVAREDVCGWPEARAIRKANAQTVANFL